MIPIDLPLASFDAPIQVRAFVLHDIAPHLADILTFAVHRYMGGWKVSNVETGGGVRETWAINRSTAISNARAYLAKKSRLDALEALHKFDIYR